VRGAFCVLQLVQRDLYGKEQILVSAFSGRPLAEIEEHDLRQLIDNETTESSDLEFKLLPPDNSDAQKIEFLKDVTGFANTRGGHLVFGIAESDGIAVELAGLNDPPADAAVRRLQDMLLGSIEPRLTSVNFKIVKLEKGGYALVLHIPRSWRPPHRVAFAKHRRFYIRGSGRTDEADVEQLRALFLGGTAIEQRLEEFRADRLARLDGQESGVILRRAGRLLALTVPLTFDSAGISIIDQHKLMNSLWPNWGQFTNYRINFDGFLIYTPEGTGPRDVLQYVQIFRDGRVEMAAGGLIFPHGRSRSETALDGVNIVAKLSAVITTGTTGLLRCGVPGPFAVMISLLDIGGTRLLHDSYRPPTGTEQIIDRQQLHFDPILIEDETKLSGLEHPLLPVLDALWNAYGYDRCEIARNADGSWRGVSAG
jgi:hypothetical protein